MRIRNRIQLITLMRIRIRDPEFHFDADPDPTFQFDADPGPTFQFDADPDPTFQFDADPDPQHRSAPGI
jgi:hypothetical protein